MKYFIKTPWLLKKLYPGRQWNVDTKEKVVYLTFDDGPHPVATPFVLDELKKYNARATFFCIGKNVEQYPAIYDRILEEGHQVGNHTQNHPDGWKTKKEDYLADVAAAKKYIRSSLFRPPYGRLRSAQARAIPLALQDDSATIVMWDVLSGDFDTMVSKEKCLENAEKGAEPGSIIVFHDSEKAFPNLVYALPKFLLSLSRKGFAFKSL